MKLKASLMSLAGLASPASAAIAQQSKGTNEHEPGKSTASAMAVESLATAASLVRYGDANKDALSLITAARIMNQVGSSPSKAEAVDVKPGEAKAGKSNVEAILARAKQYAGSRADLVDLANDVSASGSRRATGGLGRKTTFVSRGNTDVYRVTFRGGEPALVLVSRDGNSALICLCWTKTATRSTRTTTRPMT